MRRKIAKPDPLQRMSLEEVRDIVKKISGEDAELMDRLEAELSLLRLKRMSAHIAKK
jgi:hypothetical protein